MSRDLHVLKTLMQHEIRELSARVSCKTMAHDWARAFEHQARGWKSALAMVESLLAGERPGAGACSAGAKYFHEYGELLAVPPEILAAMPVEVRMEDGSRRQFYAVHQFESDEAGVVHFRSIPSAFRVGEDNLSDHGRS